MKIKELFTDALPLISQYAPTLGAAIGGPFGAAAGYALPVLASAFNHNPTDVRGLVQKIMDDKDAQGKLKNLECEHGECLSLIQNSFGNLSKAGIHINLEWNQPEK